MIFHTHFASNKCCLYFTILVCLWILSSKQARTESFFHHYTTGIKFNSGVSEAFTKELISKLCLKGGQLLINQVGEYSRRKKEKTCVVKAGKNTSFSMSFPQPQHYKRKKCTRKRNSVFQVRQPLPGLYDSTGLKLSGYHRVFPVAGLGERPTGRESMEDCPFPGINLAVRQSELGTIALHASGRRCPSLKSQSLTATFYLRQGWSCHKPLSLISSLTIWSPRCPDPLSPRFSSS